MNDKFSQVLYFGQPGVNREPNKDSLKPPKDYEKQTDILKLLNNFKIECPIIYVNLSDTKNAELIEKFGITDSHIWILELKNGKFESYDNDRQFFDRIS